MLLLLLFGEKVGEKVEEEALLDNIHWFFGWDGSSSRSLIPFLGFPTDLYATHNFPMNLIMTPLPSKESEEEGVSFSS